MSFNIEKYPNEQQFSEDLDYWETEPSTEK